MSDYYNILGVTRDASAEDIKKAYRKMAHKHHPDKDGGDEETFKKINEAYQVLGNEQKRAQYDQFGQTFEGGGAGPFGGFGGFGQGVNMEDLGGLGDIFEQLFGGGTRTRREVRRGRDVAVDVTISFSEAARGLKRELTHRLYQTCDQCRGSGAQPDTPIETCTTCGGQGTVSHTRQTPFGVFSQRSVCTTCQGEGKQPKVRCDQCRGEGRQMVDRTLEVEIPAGIADGQTIRVNGKGEVPARSGLAGDLYVTIHVTADKDLVRDGDNVRSRASISFTDAALGVDIQVRTLDGEQTLTIPAGTQPGTELRFERKGFPQLGGSGRGDHIVTVDVEIPRRLSRQQRKLLEEFRHSKKKKFPF